MRAVAPVAIPVLAVGITLGAVLSGSGSTNVTDSAFGRQAVDAPDAAAFAAASGTVTSPATRTATTGTATTPAPASSFASGAFATAQLGDVATAPVAGTGAAVNLHQTAAQAAASMNCTLEVPADPLSARGLATPWRLGDGCSMVNAGTEGAFVEATILSRAGRLSVYNPLVITAGTTPAVRPAPPAVPAGATVEISIGFNGANLALTGAGATQGHCVDALGQSLIGKASGCNAVSFYKAANADIAHGTLKVPAAGTSDDGQRCETTRDFALIDQDQSDNVATEYLINGNGQTAQASAANLASMTGATALTNGIDGSLLADFVDPADGCVPFTATDGTAPDGSSGSLALSELQARVDQRDPIAVVPPNDEMTLVGGDMSVAKTNVYRSLVGQPLLAAGTNPAAVAASYCQNMVDIAAARNALDLTRDSNLTTPVAATGDNLATFLGDRLSMSFTDLGCANYGLTNPVTVTLNGDRVATAVTYDVAGQTATTAR